MINSWKNYLLNLPDAVFFEIMRNYLGNLKTPFNKHDLIRSLTTVISKKEIKERIFSMIDSDDSRLLTAVALLDTAQIDELYKFTRHYYSFLELHNRIANLQERLLICVDSKKMIRLNPVFEDELVSGYLDTSKLFPTISRNDGPSAPWLNEQLLAAFISFIQTNSSVFSSSGNGRKKAESKFSTVFRTLSGNDACYIINYLSDICRALGFVNTAGEIRINIQQIKKFGDYPELERKILLAAAAVTSFRIEPEQSIYFDTAARMISNLFKSLPSGTRLHDTDLQPFLYLIRRETAKTNPDAQHLSNELITDALCHCGFLVKEDDFRLLCYGEDSSTDEKLRIQSNFEISTPAGCPLKDEINAACCSEITGHDITRSYELNRKAFASALDSGLKPQDIIDGLASVSAGTIPQNILFSLKAWIKEYESISLNFGVVMTVDAARLPLIQHNPQLNEFFTAVPAPGVFILDPARENQWRKAFTDAGFDMLPVTTQTVQSERTALKLPGFSTYGNIVESWDGGFKDQSTKIIKGISKQIKKMPIPEEQKQKLDARAKKKLILSDTQLTVSNKPEERGEAGGLDHRAKIRLTERALELENLLEVTTARDLELEKRLIKPLRLVKADSENPDKPPVFKIEGIELPDENEFIIPITRISYLKMLKSSLFTP